MCEATARARWPQITFWQGMKLCCVLGPFLLNNEVVQGGTSTDKKFTLTCNYIETYQASNGNQRSTPRTITFTFELSEQPAENLGDKFNNLAGAHRRGRVFSFASSSWQTLAYNNSELVLASGTEGREVISRITGQYSYGLALTGGMVTYQGSCQKVPYQSADTAKF
jgi:hypothetical protein